MKGYTNTTATAMGAFTALFKTTRALKFKKQLTFEFFAAVNHLSGRLKKTVVYFNGPKRFVICDWLISIRFGCFFISGFVACDRNYD